MKNNHVALIRDLHRQAESRSFVLEFHKNPASTEEVELGPIPTIRFGAGSNMLYPKQKPEIPLYSAVSVGKLPTDVYALNELKKDWMVTRAAGTKNIKLAVLPPLNCPILVNYENRDEPVEGFMTVHRIDAARLEYVFMELDRAGGFEVSTTVPTRLGHNSDVCQMSHIPQIRDGIIGWVYLNSRGSTIKEPDDRDALELFMDLEFDGPTLLSAGIIFREGLCFYSVDRAAVKAVKDPWVAENVVPRIDCVLPPATTISELTPEYDAFQWFSDVISGATKTHWYEKVVVRVDYTTDVERIAAFMHRLNAAGGIERFNNEISSVEFIVDYVDAYPSDLTGAAQHNAMWDAVALWCKLGYDRYYADRGRNAQCDLKDNP